jgi:starvation-inducible outer membrane lipoprotein
MKTEKLLKAFLLFSMAALLVSCNSKPSDKEKAEKGHEAQEVTQAASEPQDHDGHSLQPVIIKGKVLETIDSSGYTYVKFSSGSGESWAAVPETEVVVGEEIELLGGQTMNGFHSRTLNRTFNEIIFANAIKGKQSKKSSAHPKEFHKPAAQKPAPNQPSNKKGTFASALSAENAGQRALAAQARGTSGQKTTGGSIKAVMPYQDLSTEIATGENAYNIEQLYEKAAQLNGKTIRVRGKIVKISLMIMGKNWIHIQDGSGNPMKNTHDLVLTTKTTPKKNEIVIFEGKLAANKDFGAGYKYKVIIEDAVIK